MAAEKYWNYADKGTGINPFLPVSERREKNVVIRVGKAAVGVVLAAVRLPLFAVAASAVFLSASLRTPLPSALSQLWRRSVEALLLRVLLFTVGIWSLPSDFVEPRRMRARPAESGADERVRGGDVLLAQLSSWVDIAILSMHYSCDFLLPAVPSGDQSAVVRMGLLSALASALTTTRPTASHPSALPLHEALQAATAAKAAPVALFAEGVRTNGKGVLRYAVQLPAADKLATMRIHVCGLRAVNGSACPVGSAALHLLRMTASISCSAHVLRLSAPVVAATIASQADGAVDALRTLQARLCRGKPLDLDAERKAAFVDYYLKVAAGGGKLRKD